MFCTLNLSLGLRALFDLGSNDSTPQDNGMQNNYNGNLLIYGTEYRGDEYGIMDL